MKLRFTKLDPSGNTTILVFSPVSRSKQPGVASRLMGTACLCAEQVGFVEDARLPGARTRLQMMGSEFCGNASMSLAALLARRDGLPVNSSARYALEVSGAKSLVHCQVTREDEFTFLGTASMPLPEDIGKAVLSNGFSAPLVRFPGIAHLLVPEDVLTSEAAEGTISSLCEALDADALGILLLSADGSTMRPLVYVRSTGSAVWERGCGSGTAAVAAYRVAQTGEDVFLALNQPGGTIRVRATCVDNRLASIEIMGRVRLVAEGDVYV